MEVVVEIAEPGRRAPSIKRFNLTEIRIGRAWDNDLVITDAEVDPYHVKLIFDDLANAYEIQDLESGNGTRVKGKKFGGRSQGDFDEPITIGQTSFRIHRISDAVAPAKIHSRTEQILQKVGQPWTAILVAFAAIFLIQYSAYIGSGQKFEWNNQLQGFIAIAFGLVAWALLWGGITKLLKHQFKVWAHLGLAASILILSLLIGMIEGFLSFNLLSPSISELLEALGISLLIFVWVLLGFIVTTVTKLRTRVVTASVLASLFLLTSFLLPKIQTQSWVGLVPLETKSLPPGLKIAPSKTTEHFLQRIQENIEDTNQRAITAREEKERES